MLPDASLADSAQVRIVVDPGPQFRFGRLNIVNPAPPALSEADEIDRKEAEGFAEGEVARSGVIRAAGRLEVEAWRQQGHPKAELAERRVEALHDRNLIEVTLVIDPGPKAQFGPVTVEGTERMDAEFVAYMADIPEGAEFDPDDLALAEERLQRLEVFASARAVEAEKVGPGGSLPISFIVQERLPRRFGIGGTLSTIDGAGVEAFWQHRNLFGRAERRCERHGFVTPDLAEICCEGRTSHQAAGPLPAARHVPVTPVRRQMRDRLDRVRKGVPEIQ